MCGLEQDHHGTMFQCPYLQNKISNSQVTSAVKQKGQDPKISAFLVVVLLLRVTALQRRVCQALG